MMRRHFIAMMAGGVLALLLVSGTGAFGGSASETKAAPPALPAVGAGGSGAKEAPVAAPAATPVFIYRTVGKSDPFRPFIETDPAVKKKREEDLKKKPGLKSRPISPLQQSDIEQFRLVGIIGDEKSRTAIVEDRIGKKFYPLFVGTFIGLNGGRVAAIDPDRVIVAERAATEGRKVQIRRITVMLHKEDEGKP
jgi:Tfp pilus assembly protein PilP